MRYVLIGLIALTGCTGQVIDPPGVVCTDICTGQGQELQSWEIEEETGVILCQCGSAL